MHLFYFFFFFCPKIIFSSEGENRIYHKRRTAFYLAKQQPTDLLPFDPNSEPKKKKKKKNEPLPFQSVAFGLSVLN